jgi:hypothetical protein
MLVVKFDILKFIERVYCGDLCVLRPEQIFTIFLRTGRAGVDSEDKIFIRGFISAYF